MPANLKNNKAFTLIELLVVISIIGILTTLIAANLNSARGRARDAQRKSDIRNIATALRLYYNDSPNYNSGQYTYPRNDSSNQIKGCGAGATSCLYGGAWVVGTTTYMTKIPSDPLPSQSYAYKWNPLNNGADTYSLTACLENKSDPAGSSSVNAATVSGMNCPSGWYFQIMP